MIQVTYKEYKESIDSGVEWHEIKLPKRLDEILPTLYKSANDSARFYVLRPNVIAVEDANGVITLSMLAL